MNPKKTYLNFRNSLFTITKSLPGKQVFLVLLLRLLMDLIAGIRFILQGKTRHCMAIAKAHLSFYKNFRPMYRKRKNVTFTRNYYRTTSIVWSYFVNQVGNFNDLIKN